MKTHHLKTWPVFFQMLLDGKRAEIRRNDRNFEKGDELILEEYDPERMSYTNRAFAAEVTEVIPLNMVPGLDDVGVDNFVMLIIRPTDETADAHGKPILVLKFAQDMIDQLMANADKGDFRKCMLTRGQLLDNLQVQVWKLGNAAVDLEYQKDGAMIEEVERRAANVGNYAALMAQWARNLRKETVS